MALVTLIAAFYSVENWRGKRAWEECKREVKAKGEVLDWSAYIPPPVPDDQNIFKTTKMQEWFVGRGSNYLSERLTNAASDFVASSNRITTKVAARAYLEWSDQLSNEFNTIREALRRPYSVMEGNYQQPHTVPIPNFVTIRKLARTLVQRAHCELLLNKPDDALGELTLLHDLSRLLEARPTGKPMTLLAAMINVALAEVYVQAVADGLKSQTWEEPQLAAIQRQLEEVDLLPFVGESLKEERVYESQLLEHCSPEEISNVTIGLEGGSTNLWHRLKNPVYTFLIFAPRGWMYQNMVKHIELTDPWVDSFDLPNRIVVPEKAREASKLVGKLRKTPYNFLEFIFLPNFSKAIQTLARNQTLANEAQIACALERYRRAHGEYPESLDSLTPQFITRLPHDIIGGQPLKYRRTDNGGFLLYSIAWNETDDGGKAAFSKDGKPDLEQGDWVWQMPTADSQKATKVTKE